MRTGHLALGAAALACLAAWGLVSVVADVPKNAVPDDPNGFIDAAIGEAPTGRGGPSGGGGNGVGPDVVVGDIFDLRHYTTNGPIDGMRSYIGGTISCNVGTENLNWIAETNQHPVIAQGLYRMRDGRFEQVSQSWLKHGFFALWDSLCDNCNGSYNSCNGDCLVVGCSDPYYATLNGDNSGQGLGPRTEVNPATGQFPFPHSRTECGTTPLCGRLQVRETDIERYSQGTRASYFLEAQYVSPDDALAGNAHNNASFREVWFNVYYAMTFNIPGAPGFSHTVQQQPALTAWQAADPSVEISIVDIPGDGRIYLASKVVDKGDGTWSYEYAVHNLNSHRAISAFSMPVTDTTALTEVGFHDVDYHSGELIDGTDWADRHALDVLEWETQPWEANQNANAIRWGTLYNFRFTADAPPVQGRITLGLFRPPTAGSPEETIKVVARVPQFSPTLCAADIVGISFAPPGDGQVNSADLAFLLGAWGDAAATPGGTLADIVSNVTFAPPGDGEVDGADLAFLLGAWGVCE